MPADLQLVYAISGEDLGAGDDLLGRLRRRVEGDGGSVFVLVDRPVAEVESEIMQGGLLGGQRLLVLRHCERLRKPDAERVARALHSLAPDTVVCLVADGEMPAALTAAAGELGQVLHHDSGTPLQLVRGASRRAGVRLDAGAEQFLTSVTASLGVRALDGEMRKLGLLDGVVDEQTVRDLCVPDWVDVEPWELLNALSQRDARGAVRELGRLWRSGETPARVVGLCKGRLRRLSAAKAMDARDMRASAIATALDVRPGQATRLVKDSERWTLAALARASHRLEQTERDIWALGSGAGARVALERALPAICR